MSCTGDHRDEMPAQPVLDDHQIAALLAGEAPGPDGEFTELARFLHQVRHAAGPAPRVSPGLEAVFVHGLTDGPPAPRVTARSKGARRMLTRVAVVAGGLTLLTTGAAAADLLPRPAQDGVAALVERITPLDVPDSDDGTEPPAPYPSQPALRPDRPQEGVGSEVQERGSTSGGAGQPGERPQGGAAGAVNDDVADPGVANKPRTPVTQGNGGGTTRPPVRAEPGPQPVPPGRGHVPDPSTPAPAQPRAGDNPGTQRRP